MRKLLTDQKQIIMSNYRVNNKNEDFDKTLGKFEEAYSKPATRSEYLFVAVWLVLLPIIGIICYVYELSWIFYIIGGIITLTEIVFLFTGALRCLGSILLIVSCIIGYSITKSLLIGLLLGSCITASILSIGLIVMMCFTGMTTITEWFKR